MMAGWVPSLPQAGFGDNWDSGNQWIPNGSSGIPSENDYAWTGTVGWMSLPIWDLGVLAVNFCMRNYITKMIGVFLACR